VRWLIGPHEEGSSTAAVGAAETEGTAEAARASGAPEGVITRRHFLRWGLGSVTAAIAAVLGAFGLPPIIAPAFRHTKSPWSPIGKVGAPEAGQADLALQGQVVSTTFTRTVADAFMPPQAQQTAVFVVNLGNGQFDVFDARCTHLGCPLSWNQTTNEFYCPCHGGVFNMQGNVVAGPPPRQGQ
jgi:Rieske Fe-S protein